MISASRRQFFQLELPPSFNPPSPRRAPSFNAPPTNSRYALPPARISRSPPSDRTGLDCDILDSAVLYLNLYSNFWIIVMFFVALGTNWQLFLKIAGLPPNTVLAWFDRGVDKVVSRAGTLMSTRRGSAVAPSGGESVASTASLFSGMSVASVAESSALGAGGSSAGPTSLASAGAASSAEDQAAPASSSRMASGRGVASSGAGSAMGGYGGSAAAKRTKLCRAVGKYLTMTKTFVAFLAFAISAFATPALTYANVRHLLYGYEVSSIAPPHPSTAAFPHQNAAPQTGNTFAVFKTSTSSTSDRRGRLAGIRSSLFYSLSRSGPGRCPRFS